MDLKTNGNLYLKLLFLVVIKLPQTLFAFISSWRELLRKQLGDKIDWI